MKKILCICFSSTIQKTVNFNCFKKLQVNRSTSYVQHASGKAINTLRVLNQLEKKCALAVCPLGTKNYKIFLGLAKNDDLQIKYTKIPGFTRECLTFLDDSEHSTTEFVISEPPINISQKKIKKIHNRFWNIIAKNIKKSCAIVLSGSRPAFWNIDMYTNISNYAKKYNKFFLADFTGEDLLKTINFSTPNIIKINEEEYISTFNLKNDDFTEEKLKESIVNKSKELNNMIIVTRGTDLTFAANKGQFYSVPTPKVKAINTIACGDSFNAGFIYEYLKSKDFELALKKGTECASINAQLITPGAIF